MENGANAYKNGKRSYNFLQVGSREGYKMFIGPEHRDGVGYKILQAKSGINVPPGGVINRGLGFEPLKNDVFQSINPTTQTLNRKQTLNPKKVNKQTQNPKPKTVNKP